MIFEFSHVKLNFANTARTELDFRIVQVDEFVAVLVDLDDVEPSAGRRRPSHGI